MGAFNIHFAHYTVAEMKSKHCKMSFLRLTAPGLV